MSLRENYIFGADLIWCRCKLAKENFSKVAQTKFGANRSFKSNICLFFSKFSNYRGKTKFDATGKKIFYTGLICRA